MNLLKELRDLVLDRISELDNTHNVLQAMYARSGRDYYIREIYNNEQNLIENRKWLEAIEKRYRDLDWQRRLH